MDRDQYEERLTQFIREDKYRRREILVQDEVFDHFGDDETIPEGGSFIDLETFGKISSITAWAFK